MTESSMPKNSKPSSLEIIVLGACALGAVIGLGIEFYGVVHNNVQLYSNGTYLAMGSTACGLLICTKNWDQKLY
jgi:hypothetical protein